MHVIWLGSVARVLTVAEDVGAKVVAPGVPPRLFVQATAERAVQTVPLGQRFAEVPDGGTTTECIRSLLRQGEGVKVHA